MKTTIIGMYNRKGGIGKTASVVNLSAILTVKGYRVLIIDADSQINATSYLLDGEEGSDLFWNGGYHEEDAETIATLTKCNGYTPTPRKRIFTKSRGFAGEAIYTMDIIPGSKTLVQLEDEDLVRFVENLDSIRERNEYDFIFIDMPGFFNNIVLASLMCCDYLLIPSEADKHSVDGFDDLFGMVANIRENGYNENLAVLGVFINKLKQIRVFQNAIIQNVEAALPDGVLMDTMIPDDSKVPEAIGFGLPLEFYAPSSKANKKYRDLSDEIIRRTAGEE